MPRGPSVGSVAAATRTPWRWNEFDGLSMGGTAAEQGVDSLMATMDALRPADLANVLQDLPHKRRLEVARNLDDERLADVLEELPEDDRVQILTELDLRARRRRPGGDGARRRR